MTAIAVRGLIGTVLLVLVAGCAGDDEDSTAPTGTAPTEATAVTPAPTTAAAPGGTTVGAPGGTAVTTTAAVPAGSTTTAPVATTAAAATAPDPVVRFTEVATAEQPVDLAWREGDDGLYVVEQDGRILRVGGDGGEPAVVLDMTELTSAAGERGLLGLAFAPSGDVAYVNYTDNNGDTVIAEHPVSADGTFGTGDDARVVLFIEQPYRNHNGGAMEFGPDGLLYVGMGDGGAGGDPERRATDLSSLLGKILRIDPAIAAGQPYTAPEDNPFVGTDGAAPEVWASGLRNPWRISFDGETGDLWIADVGQNAFEEINVAPATGGRDAGRGLSFGWSAFEGEERFNDDVDDAGHTFPIAGYGHDAGCSISGGRRARGAAVPSLDGWYVFADYCSGQVLALEVFGAGADLAAGRSVSLGEAASPTAVVDGPAGELYVLSHDGPILRLDPA